MVRGFIGRCGRRLADGGRQRRRGRQDDKDGLESDARAAERLTFFSDAVIAIAITLLAIELPLPEGHSVHAFWHSVKNDAGHYAAFLISFIAAPGLHAPAQGPRRARHLTRTLVTARPRPGWLARTVTVPGSPGRERIQTAPAPPAAAKSNGLSPTRMAGPSTSSVTWPDT